MKLFFLTKNLLFFNIRLLKSLIFMFYNKKIAPKNLYYENIY